MNSEQARARRAELEVTLATAQRNYSEGTVNRAQAEAERAAAVRSLAALKTARASGGASGGEVDAAHKRLAKADQSVAGQHELTNAALDAVKALEYQLDELFGANLEAFVEDAEAATRRAAKALLAVEAPFEAARDAWEAAARAWAPLARAARVEGVGRFPVADAFRDVRAGAVVARPPSVLVTTAAQEADGLE